MERILILIGPSGIDTASLDFACYLCNLSGSKLTGLFLHAETKTELSQLALPGPRILGTVVPPVKIPLEHSLTASAALTNQFNSFCENRGLKWKPDVLNVQDTAEVMIETRFSDILLVSADLSITDEREEVPSEMVQEILRNAECPVLVAPLSFSEVTEIVFAYDGSASAVYAIRQFTHLFPNLQDHKVTLLEVNDDFGTELKYKDKIINYLKMHYSTIGYKVLAGKAENELFSFFLGKENVMIVMGAFGRRYVSSILRHSTADLVMKTTPLPIFIAHR